MNRLISALLIILASTISTELRGAQVTFSVTMTASGDEITGYELKEHWGTFPYFELQGNLLERKPSETKTVTLCLSKDEFPTCEIDTSRSGGQGGPGYGIFIDEINSPGADAVLKYSLDTTSRCLTSTVKVTAKRKQRGWYAGRHVIYASCEIRSQWSNTQTEGPFTLDSSAGYAHLATYTGKIGSAAGVSGTAKVYSNDNGYKARIVGKSPAAAIITSGMFASSPEAGGNGPRFHALYEPNDINAEALEISQGVQNLRNYMPLVSGRRTMARFYVRSRHPASNIDAQLRAYRNGVELSGSPLRAEATTQVRAIGIDRTVLDHAFLFKIPQKWTAPGNVEFRSEVNMDGLADELHTLNNAWSEYVVFQVADRSVETIVPVPLHLHENRNRDKPVRIYASDNTTFYPLMKHVLRMHPIAEVLEFDCELGPVKPVGHDILPFREWDYTDSDEWEDMVARVAFKRFWSGCGFSDSFWAGMVDPNLPGSPGSFGIAVGGGQSSVTYMEYKKQQPWQIPRGQTYAHEIGHNKDLDHECRIRNPKGVDENYPYNDPCLLAKGNPAFFSNGHDGYFMLDVYHDYWGLPAPAIIGSNQAGVVDFRDNQASPMMSYGPTRWISPYSYCKLLEGAGISCDPLLISARRPKSDEPRLARLRGGLASDRPAEAAVRPDTQPSYNKIRIDELMVTPIDPDADSWLVVEGTFDLTTGTVRNFRLTRLDEVPNPNALSTAQAAHRELADLLSVRTQELPPVLVLWQFNNATSRRVSRVDLVSRLDQGSSEGGSRRFFIHLLELAPDAGYFELTYGADVVATLAPSGSAPRVSFEFFPDTKLTAESVLRWTSADGDGDTLTYSIFYSADGGKRWQLVESDLSGFEYRIRDAVADGDDPLRAFAGTKSGLFRVMAFDGFHTTVDDLDVTLTVPGSAPRVAIMQPDGYAVEVGQTTYLTGEAFDREDGPIPTIDARMAALVEGQELSTRALRWTSSHDGALGYGPEIRTRKLSKGVHLITFLATDSDGQTSSARIRLYVGVPNVPLPNVALIASATASSTYCTGAAEHCYDARTINDDDRSTALGGPTSWSNSQSVPTPHWVQLAWSTGITTGSIELYTTAGYELQDYDIEARENGVWKTVVSIRGNREAHRVHCFPDVTTNAIRLVALAGPAHQKHHARVNELVVYDTR